MISCPTFYPGHYYSYHGIPALGLVWVEVCAGAVHMVLQPFYHTGDVGVAGVAGVAHGLFGLD